MQRARFPNGVYNKHSKSVTNQTKFHSLIVADEHIRFQGERRDDACAKHYIFRPSSRAVQIHRFGWKYVLKVTVKARSSLKHIHLTKKQFLFNTTTGHYVKAQLLRVGDHVATMSPQMLPIGKASMEIMKIESGGYQEVLEVVSHDRICYALGEIQLSVTSLQSYSDHEPIHSFGVIAFRLNLQSKEREYMLVERRCSMGFQDLVRGKYCDRPIHEICQTYLQEMTREERFKITNWSFQQLWYSIWHVDMSGFTHWKAEQMSPTAQIQYNKASANFEKLNIHEWIARLGPSLYENAEMGFPKGRSSFQERPWETAVREFIEEVGCRVHILDLKGCLKTSHSEGEIKEQANPADVPLYMDSSVPPFVENFQATNGLRYTHTYFLAYFGNHSLQPTVTMDNPLQANEIGSVGFYTFQDALSRLRPYDREKKEVLIKVETFLRN